MILKGCVASCFRGLRVRHCCVNLSQQSVNRIGRGIQIFFVSTSKLVGKYDLRQEKTTGKQNINIPCIKTKVDARNWQMFPTEVIELWRSLTPRLQANSSNEILREWQCSCPLQVTDQARPSDPPQAIVLAPRSSSRCLDLSVLLDTGSLFQAPGQGPAL